jgi:hypothetical protein
MAASRTLRLTAAADIPAPTQDQRESYALPTKNSAALCFAFAKAGIPLFCTHLNASRTTKTMLIRLIYVSKVVDSQSSQLSESILKKAHAWNTENDITGVLCEGQGVFLQALEGERGAVTRLYARISADRRHTELELIHCESITERHYGEWSMAHVSLSDVDPQTKIVWPEFNPYSASGLLVMSRIAELIAQGRMVTNAAK